MLHFLIASFFTVCTGAMDAFSTIIRTEGIVALYKGMVPTLVGAQLLRARMLAFFGPRLHN